MTVIIKKAVLLSMWIAFEIFVNFFQAFLVLWFVKSRLHIARKNLALDAGCVLLVGLYTSFYLFYDVPVPDAFVFFIPFGYALAVADDKWYVSAFWASILALLFLSIISLSLHVFMTIPGGSYEKLMQMTWGRFAFVMVTNAILTIMVYAISKLKKDYSSPYRLTLVLFLAANVALFTVEEALYKLQLQIDSASLNTNAFFWAYIALFACTLLIILLYHNMSLSVERETRYRAEATVAAQSKQFQAEIEMLYNNLRIKAHDFKHHYEALKEMVRKGNSEEAKAYLASYQQSICKEELILTGSTAVDSLLLAKVLTMKKMGITFRYSPYPLDQLPIEEPDFCTIIGNLLDNAIEGTLRVDPTSTPLTIHLTFSRSWDMFYIYCANPCNAQTIKKSNGAWLSSKEADGLPGLHAVGIRSMQQIVQRAEGRCSFASDNGVFNVKIVLPCKTVETEEGQ